MKEEQKKWKGDDEEGEVEEMKEEQQEWKRDDEEGEMEEMKEGWKEWNGRQMMKGVKLKRWRREEEMGDKGKKR